jgi:hypothetical protein
MIKIIMNDNIAYDPIMLEDVNIQEWINNDINNVIFYFDDITITTNKVYF